MAKTGYSTKVIQQNEVVVNLTEKCNNRCLNCPNDDNFLRRCISDVEVEKFIDENVSGETDRVTFIGGEPTISKNFFDSIKKVRMLSNKAIIQINSNGRMFCYGWFVDKLAEYGVDKFDIHVALYGHFPELHDELTFIRGSYKQTVQGIINLLNRGFSVQIRTIVSNLNYKYLPDIGRMMVEKFKGKISKFNFVGMDIIGNAKKNEKVLAVSHLKIAPYIEKTIDVLNSNGIYCNVHLLPKGIFKKRYHDFAIKSGCVDGAFTDSFGCVECIYHDSCPRMMKSYVAIFGNKEHLPCIKC